MDEDTQGSQWVDHIIDTPGRVLGPRASYAMLNDPRRLAIVLSRYKFCAKMLKGKGRVLEVGCGDAFGTPLVAQEADEVLAVDIDEQLIQGDRDRLSDLHKITFAVHDITKSRPPGEFGGAYSLDVLEHIDPRLERDYFENVCACLSREAILVVGVPNITADKHASKPGHSPHINLKDEDMLRASFEPFFENTLIFSMNDEVVHTGFTPMAHYLFAVGIGRKAR